MIELEASNHILGDAHAVREAIDAQGYVFFRDVLDRELIRHVKQGVMAWFEARGVIRVVDDQPVHTGADVARFGEYPPGLFDTRLWEWFALRPEMRGVYQRVLGESGYVIPIGQYQFTWPGKLDWLSRSHQDGFFTPGLEFFTFWVPLMEIDETLGGVAIVPGPQSIGLLHPEVEPNIFIPSARLVAEPWARADYRPGDLLIFGPFTPHCPVPNSSDCLRLSIDFRVTPASAKRAITGVVIGTGPDHVVIAADSGEELTLGVGTRSVLFVPPDNDEPERSGHSSWNGRAQTTRFLGHRVIATADNGQAQVIRTAWGCVPWEQ